MTAIFLATVSLVLNVFTKINGFQYCMDNCYFSQSLDAPFNIANHCNKTTMDYLCQVNIKIDYTGNRISVRFGSMIVDDRKRSIDDKYDYISETTIVNSTNIKTTLIYTCTLGNQCEQDFSLKIIPKLIQKNYVEMQQKLMDILMTDRDSSNLICYEGTQQKSFDCNGTCYGERTQLINGNFSQQILNLLFSPSCEHEKYAPSVAITALKTPMGKKEVLTREINIRCSKNYCNGPETTDRIENIINQHYIAFYQQSNI